MIIYHKCSTFKVLGENIFLYSEEISTINTVAEVNNSYYYLGDSIPDIAAAVFAWQSINNRELSDEEFHQIMIDNNLFNPII
jgi:hypothetical protein